MMTQAMYEEGITYAEENFLNEQAVHLHVDKKLIRERFNLDGKTVLDFGCGMGGMSLWYAKNFRCVVYGVDIDRHHITVATELRSRHGVDNAHFEVRNILEKPFDKKFDFIVLNDVAEHIPLPVLKEIFVKLSKSLAFGGGVFVSYPPWKSPYASHVSHITGIPWCQFLPEGMLLKMIEKNNRPIVGEEESDLLQAYKGLNHLTHGKLMKVIKDCGLQVCWRKSHSFINKFPFLKNMNINFFPFSFLVTKEFLYLENKRVA